MSCSGNPPKLQDCLIFNPYDKPFPNVLYSIDGSKGPVERADRPSVASLFGSPQPTLRPNVDIAELLTLGNRELLVAVDLQDKLKTPAPDGPFRETGKVDPRGFVWRGISLYDSELTEGGVRAMVKKAMKPPLSSAELVLATSGELNHPYWPIIEATGMNVADAIKRYEATLNMLTLAEVVAMLPALQLKRYYDVPRPYESFWGVDTLTPSLPLSWNPSFPGGHSTLTDVAARLIAPLAGFNLDKLLERMRPVGEHRMRGGLHTEADTAAGHKLGQMVAEELKVQMTQQDKPAWREICLRVYNEWS